MKRFLPILFATLPASAVAHDYNVNGLKIEHPVARATTETARTSAGYMMIENTGDEGDVLLAVEADFPRVELHTTTVTDGVASMQMMMNVPVPAGESVVFEQGGMHVMFMGLSEPMIEGETVPAVLVFENAGRVEIDFNIEKIEAKGHDHSNH